MTYARTSVYASEKAMCSQRMSSYHGQENRQTLEVELRKTSFPTIVERLCTRLLTLSVEDENEYDGDGPQGKVDVEAERISGIDGSLSQYVQLTTTARRAYP